VTEEDALGCHIVLSKRVGCPSCGGFQVYDLVESCWACGKTEREQRLVRTSDETGAVKHVDVGVVIDGYDIDVRVRCADPKCVQWGSACSKCGACEDTDIPRVVPLGARGLGNLCTNCRAPWPRTRTRWRTEAKGACAGKDPASNDPDRGCGWVAA
jgi:hypothetical protein